MAVNARRAPAPLCTAEMPHHHPAERWKRVGPPALAVTASRGRRSSCYPLRAAAPTRLLRRPPLWAWLLLLLPSARAGAVLKETGRACSGNNGATAAYQAKHMGNYTTPDACADAAAEDPDCTGWVIAYPPNYGTNPNWGCRCCKGDGSGGPLNPNWNLYAITAKTPPPAPPAAPPVCASTTDIQTACGRPIKADCAAGNGGSDGSCEMGAVSSANGGGTAYSECTEVTSIVAAKTGQWGYLGLRDGKISQNGSPGDRRNYRLQVTNSPTSHTAHALCIADGVVEYCLNSWCETSPSPPPPSASPSPPPPTQALLDCFASRSFPDGTLQKSGEPPRDPTSTRGPARSRPPLTTHRQCRFPAPRVELRLRGRQRLQHAQRMRRRSHRLLRSCAGLPWQCVFGRRLLYRSVKCGSCGVQLDYGPISAEPAATHAAASVAAARAAGSETSAVAATSALSRALRQLQERGTHVCSAGLGWNRNGSKSTLRRGPQLHRDPRLRLRRNQLEVLH